MKKLSTRFGTFGSKVAVVASAVVVGASSAMADAVEVDLGDATESITNAGTAMIGLAVVILGMGVVYSFLRKRG